MADSRGFDTATGYVTNQLAERISAGTYRAGDALPSQRKLAEQFGVSQRTIQDAIRNLEDRGLVVAKHGKGVFVKARFSSDTTVSDARILRSETPVPAELEAIARLRFDPGYALVGAAFLALGGILQDAEHFDTRRVGDAGVTLEWDAGPNVADVLLQLLPRAGIDSTGVVAGVPGLRVIAEESQSASLAWLGADGVTLTLRRLNANDVVEGSEESAVLVVWTPESIRARMKQADPSGATGYRDQILDAIEAVHEKLPKLVKEASAAPAPGVQQGKLFEREVKPASERKVQLTIRHFRASHLSAIDQLVKRSAAGSRSELVTVALDAVLPPLE